MTPGGGGGDWTVLTSGDQATQFDVLHLCTGHLSQHTLQSTNGQVFGVRPPLTHGGRVAADNVQQDRLAVDARGNQLTSDL